ncbi:prostaglandin E2 receptor EP4 subtype-like [Mizuhopecten yessoensis]|uniref:Thromboxane A2 receptor n=1 Tax=Mizuhopecten yessoensis TaxID=6573 RepID=A0A210QBC0_MIZYE|nr:prostaglandin E2 receptor EP4 subtype-like [Mizuhopecten yessoensis]XP_021362602.1 prostaglandin E2 receptor EP4 subtype-like [Mizuhopecten yessoensis]XP_021362603.1 prostaglandin E2 receptor EP4 subtype-like [Mizuhopecten yessoensis]XP_021362605.1 prostaglandin E2 receptor EP4 subtype-like [Mizuhopecten yessoensis]OWF46015.1 Prostaglandin E2 receptor EP4 subtype [Mizuhopecten yessoensis]
MEDSWSSASDGILNGSFLNGSDEDAENGTDLDSALTRPMVSLVVPAVMFAAGVFGNVLALVVLGRSSREHKRTVFYRLVGGLAVTDLFGTMCTSPVTLVIYSNNLKWVGGQSLCNYSSFMLIFAGFTTLFIVCFMALDRYIALNHPYFYSAKITHHKVKYILGALWGAAFSLACLPLIGLGENVLHFPGTWCFFDFRGKELRVKMFAYLYSFIGIGVILAIFILNLIVIATVWKMRQMTSVQNSYSNIKCLDSEIQMVIFLVGILAVFGLCWAPLMVRILVIQVAGHLGTEKDDLLVIRLASFNQILDPWVYLLFRKELFFRCYTFSKQLCNDTSQKLKQTSLRSSSRKQFSPEVTIRKVTLVECLDSNSPSRASKCSENRKSPTHCILVQNGENSKLCSQEREKSNLCLLDGEKTRLCSFENENEPEAEGNCIMEDTLRSNRLEERLNADSERIQTEKYII